VVNIYFETPRTDAFNKRRTESVPFLGNQLKRTFYAKVLIDIHQCRTEITPFDVFYVVSNNHAAWKTLGPEPNERHPSAIVGLQAEAEHRLVNLLDGLIHRPSRKRNRTPILEPQLLQLRAHGPASHRPRQVVQLISKSSREQ